MPKELFPEEIIENSAESNFQKHSVKTKLIYVTTILFVVGSIITLPFIYVDVSVKSSGVIQPTTKHNKLTSLVSGKIDGLYIKENESIKKGDQVAIIAAPLLKEKIHFNSKRQKKVSRYLRDLSKLGQIDSTSIQHHIDLETPKYNHSLLQLKQEVRGHLQNVNKIQKRHSRNQKLFKRDMLSKAKHEETAYALETAENKLQLLFDQQLNKWQADRIAYQEELDQLKTKREQFKREQEQHIIRAPISGTIQNMQGIYEGSFITPNQPLAEISPDTDLIAECYVSPKDIGLIKEGMEARFQVSAFDYNQWGMLKGTVTEISNDVTVVNKQPIFIVKSRLDQSYMELENGYRGKLKKGMTMQARFTITERSLFQLLYDNVDDWLNPKWDEQQSESKEVAIK
ncbi:HlyD family secretion protein [Fodinibius halophilus]|uniref:HlyD family efflux transporter periplasmic adaptor subunit n=1 Tax=Fodinibius halophilus TaxID=1736908 RepID=A0A6M1T6M6_9BACT|nr:HlyD family efflux transporter periplasmic adaptor subunit [Fodinibius halophilus]NGP89759.1 HlyD family efflux transporter periplasmic adaptor subunit [Fodinibius halophilus]